MSTSGNEARIVLTAVDKTSAAFEQVQKNLSGVGSVAANVTNLLSGIGATAVVVAITSAVRRTADYADQMGKLAQKAGVTTEAISGLAYAAQLSDVDNQALAKGLRIMALDAENGGEKLAALGVVLQDAAGKAKTSDQLFLDVADRLSGMEDPGQRAAAAARLFGEEVGPGLLPLLLSGSKGIQDMTEEARRFGRVVNDEVSAKAQEFNDNLTRLSLAADGVAGQIAGPLIESLANTSSYFIKVANDAGIAKAALITFGGAVARTLGLDDVGKLQSAAQANQNAIALTVKQIETFQRLADRGDVAAAVRVGALREQFAKLQADGQRITSALSGEAASIESQFMPVKGSKLERPDLPSRSGGTGGRPSAGTAKDSAFTGLSYDEQIAQRVGKLCEQSDVINAKEFADTMAKLDELYFSGQIGGELYESTMRKLAGSSTKAGEASGELADEQARLARMIAGTSQAVEQDLQKDLRLLDAALAKGLIGIKTHEEAYATRLGLTGPEAKRTAQEFGATLHEDVKNALSNAFRDTKNPVEAFGDALYNVVLTRVTSGLANSIADGLLGKEGGGGGVLSGVSDWFGELLSFDGGGYTGTGSRAGGMDGRGGFLAMLHPNETVVDHTKGQSTGGVTFNLINQGGERLSIDRTKERTGSNGQVIYDVFVSALANDIAGRSGPVSRALENGWGIRPSTT